MRTRISRSALLVATGVLAAVTVAACSTGLSGAAGGPATQTVGTAAPTTVDTTIAPPPAQFTTAPAATTTQQPAVVDTRTVRTPECKSGGLKLSFGGGDAGMSHQFRELKFTNVSKHSCVIVGFPGVSYVTGDKGTQVGAPAVREGKIGKQITLVPGQFASTIIDAVDYEVFEPAVCRPTPVRGYRIYPPDETAAMFIPLPSGAHGCAGTTPSPQLSVVTIQRGDVEPDQY
jgi:hypothetical protein